MTPGQGQREGPLRTGIPGRKRFQFRGSEMDPAGSEIQKGWAWTGQMSGPGHTWSVFLLRAPLIVAQMGVYQHSEAVSRGQDLRIMMLMALWIVLPECGVWVAR